MTGKRLVLFFVVIVAVEFMLLSGVDSWRRRRRRRRYTTPPPITTPKPTSAPCDFSIPWVPNMPWANNWTHSFSAYCNHGFSISKWASLYRVCQQDRVHHFKCRSVPAASSTEYSYYCNWTPHLLHNVKHSFFYKCPDDGFITGLKSYFDKNSKDRRISLKCCRLVHRRSCDGYKYSNCHTTTTLNSIGGVLNYEVPSGYTMTGVGSFYSDANSKSDRQWMFEICQFKRSVGKK